MYRQHGAEGASSAPCMPQEPAGHLCGCGTAVRCQSACRGLRGSTFLVHAWFLHYPAPHYTAVPYLRVAVPPAHAWPCPPAMSRAGRFVPTGTPRWHESMPQLAFAAWLRSLGPSFCPSSGAFGKSANLGTQQHMAWRKRARGTSCTLRRTEALSGQLLDDSPLICVPVRIEGSRCACRV